MHGVLQAAYILTATMTFGENTHGGWQQLDRVPPERFGAIQDARAHCHVLFPWDNTEHHHSSLGLLTPSDVHHGLAEQRVASIISIGNWSVGSRCAA